MSFYEEPRFPDVIAFSAIGGPGYSTDVVVVASGYETRNQNWVHSRYSYDLSIPPRPQFERDVITAHFKSVSGRAHGFRFKDYADYTVGTTALTAAGSPAGPEGIATAYWDTGSPGGFSGWRLHKRYYSGAQTVDRLLLKPVWNTVTVKLNGSPTSFSYDASTGVVQIGGSVSTDTVTWTGEFDVPVRYDHDTLRWKVVNRNMYDGLYFTIDELRLVEIRL